MDAFRRVSFTGMLGRTLRHSLDFRSRSTRAELAVGFIAALFFVPVAAALLGFTPLDGNPWLPIALEIVAVLPLAALIVRRLHDHNRSGWWALAAIFTFALAVTRSVVAASQGFEARIALDRLIWPLDWIAIAGNIAMVVLLVLPGTAGSNRFGPDPRATD